MRSNLPLSMLVLLSSLGAQTVVVPSGQHIGINASIGLPGSWSDGRLQVLIDPVLMAGLVNQDLLGVSFLRTASSPYPFQASAAQVTVRMSTSPHGARDARAMMAANHDPATAGGTVVFQGGIVFPASPAPGARSVLWSNPSDVVSIPFTTPFRYVGGTVCLDIDAMHDPGQPSDAWTAAAMFEGVTGSVTHRGDGCGAFGGRSDPGQPFSSSSVNPRSLVPGASARFVAFGPVGTPAVLLIGATPTSIDLSALGLGASNCRLFVLDPVAISTTFADRGVPRLVAGLAQVPMTIPATSSVLGARFTAQFVEVSIPLRTSDALDCAVAGQLPSFGMASVFATSATGQPPMTGDVDPTRGPLLRFSY